jgi:hypothetical protein
LLAAPFWSNTLFSRDQYRSIGDSLQRKWPEWPLLNSFDDSFYRHLSDITPLNKTGYRQTMLHF